MELNILLYGKSDLIQFVSQFLAVLAGGVLSLAIAYWQITNNRKKKYTSTLKALFSELQENERVLRQKKKFNLTINSKKHQLLITLLSNSVLEGALSSERLSNKSSYKMMASLILLQRKIVLHNSIANGLLHNLTPSNKNEVAHTEWLFTNLQEKQAIIKQDCKRMLKVLKKVIVTQTSQKEFEKFVEEAEV